MPYSYKCLNAARGGDRGRRENKGKGKGKEGREMRKKKYCHFFILQFNDCIAVGPIRSFLCERIG